MDERLEQLERAEPDAAGKLRSVAPRLWACADETLSGDLSTAGFLLQRPQGNAFVYSCSRVERYYDHIDELGGVELILLNHRDEATPHVEALAERYRAPVRAHRAEADACIQRGVGAIERFTNPETVLGADLAAYHTPGHTPGVVSFVWDNPADQLRYLFAGDTLTNVTIDNAELILRFHAYPGNAADLQRSLRLLAELPTDVLVPGLARGLLQAYRWDHAARLAVLADLALQLDDR